MTCQLVIRMPDFMPYLCIILYIYTSSYIFVLPMSPYILFSSRTQDRSWPTWPIRCRLWSSRPFKIHSQRGRVWWAAKGMIKFLNFEMLWNPQSLPSLKLGHVRCSGGGVFGSLNHSSSSMKNMFRNQESQFNWSTCERCWQVLF